MNICRLICLGITDLRWCFQAYFPFTFQIQDCQLLKKKKNFQVAIILRIKETDTFLTVNTIVQLASAEHSNCLFISDSGKVTSIKPIDYEPY